ncbi:menin-like isoform X2 [Ornithodoros turicata]|uniref:menin-like isoform X2 n=1 Tax=Ornithodoros turicata TaxID=34597 RepID=UPI003139004E
MALGVNVKRHFPLRKIDDVVEFFRSQLENNDEPDLALLSIVTGNIENSMTSHRSHNVDDLSDIKCSFPEVGFGPIEALYVKFVCQIKGSIDLTLLENAGPTGSRELVKRVSDVIWSSLTRSYYKDRPHLQSLFSYLTGNKLDCFGVAFAVVAACQVLGFHDVHLALSEDHAWVTFGEDGCETAEVTWHGKGNEDRRGEPIPCEKSWLYLNGNAVQCSRPTEVAALVSAINPSIAPTTDSNQLICLQQQLLWLLYDKGHLRNYPMALGNLGELEGLFPTPGRPPPKDLFAEAIHAARTYYCNMHVYPYTYLGSFLYRSGYLPEALKAWADAADVIRKFNYGREDEEIYKEFMEIANDLIPQVVKLSSAGDGTLLRDAHCFAHLLRFYDGLCAWEEGSATPVLHIGWARPLVHTIAKFPASVRASATVLTSEDEEEGRAEDTPKKSCHLTHKSLAFQDANVAAKEDFLRSLESQLGQSGAPPRPDIAALAAACADNILNPGYLLCGGQPFTIDPQNISTDLNALDNLTSLACFTACFLRPILTIMKLKPESKRRRLLRAGPVWHQVQRPLEPRAFFPSL